MEEEKFILPEKPNISCGGCKAMPFIIGNEAFERLGTLGITSNLMVYLTTVFNMISVNAALLLSAFIGTSNMASLLGAFIADSGFGRFKTLAFASVSSLLGMMGLTLTATICRLHPPRCDAKQLEECVGPSFGQMLCLLISFTLLVIGAGGIRPCNLPFGADQFNTVTESGKRDIRSFFSWYYFTITFSMLIASTVIVYVQSDVSRGVGFAIATCLMSFAVALFFLGSKQYVKVIPDGSPFTSVAQVLVSATKKRQLDLPQHPSALFQHFPDDSLKVPLPYTNQFRFLEKAAIITTEDVLDLNGSATNPWRLCTVQQIEEVKCLARIMPIWASAVIFHTAMSQGPTHLVLQALQSDRHFENCSFLVPAASYMAASLLTITIWIPIYNRILIPLLQKVTGKDGTGITTLQRMGAGIVFSILTMLVSALVEQHRKHIALTEKTSGISPKGGTISSMSALWLIPQLIIFGLSEGLFCLGEIEFYYQQFPDNMKSVAGSFFFFAMGCSSYLSGFLVFIVHQMTAKAPTGNWLSEDLNIGKLNYFYCLLIALGVANFGCFMICARWFKYKGSFTTNLGVTAEQQT